MRRKSKERSPPEGDQVIRLPQFGRSAGEAAPRFSGVRSLRFRLTVSYVFFFSLLLIFVGILFRKVLISILDSQTLDALTEEWGAVKGYLRFENQRPVWFYDRYDPDEAFIVERLQQVYLLTDSDGNVLEVSPAYQNIGVDSLDQIRAGLQSKEAVVFIRKDNKGTPYMIRAGAIPDDRRRLYYLAIGRSLGYNREIIDRFTLIYSASLPLMIAISSLFGWFLAGRALEPVNSLSRTAQQITGSNLGLRIPPRGAGDELDHLIETFNSMIARLNRSFEQIRQFSTDVSHELRTPLTAIRGQLEVALFTAKTPEQYRDAMVNALQDVEQLSNIVRALLLLSQAESGQVVLQMSPLALPAIMADLVDQFQIPAEAEGVSLSLEKPHECIVKGDRTQIERLLANLLSNAIKYTPSGGRVSVRLRCGDGWAQLEVEDTGLGIPADQLPHIFDRFYRVRSASTNPIQGLGLGLSFVAWIVKAHGGKIDVSSTVGRGSRFTVMLPLVESSPQPTEPVAEVV